MALPDRNPGALDVLSQECDYGSNSYGADSLSLRAPITTQRMHPVEAAVRNYRQQQQDMEYTMATRAFGQGFAMHMRHQRAATSVPTIGHLSGVLPRSNALHDALTSRDLDLDFADTLAQDVFSPHSPHEIMERKLCGKIF